MKKQTRSLLEELELLSTKYDTKHIIENRAINLIASAKHLLEVIERNYDTDQFMLLEKKLLMSIKNRDHTKFVKSLKKSGSDNEN